MGFFDGFKKDKTLVLAYSSRNTWPEKLVKYQGLDKVFQQFTKELTTIQNALQDCARILAKKKPTIPERAEHITAEHAKVLGEHINAVTIVSFTAPLAFSQELEEALAVLERFKEHTTKNFSALREFYEEELQVLTTVLQDFEDLLINTGESFDKQKFDTILSIQSLLTDLEQEEIKLSKYEKTHQKYKQRAQENDVKQKRYLANIAQQKENIRTPETLKNLERIKEVEDQVQDISRFYERLVFDTKHFLLKNNITLNEETKNLFTNLKKDSENMLINYEQLKKEFTELHESMQELEQNDTKNVLARLQTAIQSVEKDAQRLLDAKPSLQETKKSVMQDIAALNMYEQEQFLQRAKKEGAEIEEKTEYVGQVLEEIRCEDILEGIEDLLKHFTVVVREED